MLIKRRRFQFVQAITLLFSVMAVGCSDGSSRVDTLVADLESDAPPRELRDASFGTLSTDERWVAYLLGGLSERSLFVTSFPDGQGDWKVSVDGAGSVTVFYPQAGDSALEQGSLVALPLTVTLDDAPGPEVFVARFDVPAEQARQEAEAAWSAGGVQGVRAWAAQASADAVVVQRR